MSNNDSKSSPGFPSFAAYRTPAPMAPGRPLRSSAVLEQLVETLASKVELTSRAVESIEQEMATKADVKELTAKVDSLTTATTQVRRLLDSHIKNQQAESLAQRTRHDALMGMLGTIIGRLPEPSSAGRAEEPSPTST